MSVEEQIKILKKARKSIKSACTRCKTYVDSFVPSAEGVHQLKKRQTNLHDRWIEYNETQTKLELLLETEEEDRESFEAAYFALSGKIDLILSQNNTVVTSPVSIGTEQPANINTQIRLPKISLPTFSGSYEEWRPFHDTFNSLIHTNPSISNIQRFHYLKSSLRGDAADVIHSLEIAEDNYNTAWTLIKERYDNTRLIIQSHIKAIFDLPSVSRENHIILRQIVDGTLKHIRALKALGRQTDSWDDLIIYIITMKIDNSTLKEWQTSLRDTNMPNLKQLTDFLLHKCQTLEALFKKPIHSPITNVYAKSAANRNTSVHVSTFKEKCPLCKEEHLIYHCKQFLNSSADQRFNQVKAHHLCVNCLRHSNHQVKDCKAGLCKICNKRHSTLLHRDWQRNATVANDPQIPSTSSAHINQNINVSEQDKSVSTTTAHSAVTSRASQVLLSTALIMVYDHQGKTHQCRALLDSGSQSNFITEDFSKRLGLKTESINISIMGINKATTPANRRMKIKLQSRYNAFKLQTDFIIIRKITDNLPAYSFSADRFRIPKNLKLADPNFHVSSPIDILLGTEVFWQSLCVGQVKQTRDNPTLQKTHFGWVMAGKCDTPSNCQPSTQRCHLVISNEELHDSLTQFWQLEGINKSQSLTKDEQKCEEHFLRNVSRTCQGQFMVKLPIIESKMMNLGESRSIALKRFHYLEKKLNKQPSLKEEYSSFISEYLALGHMRKIKELETLSGKPHFYLPHHAVIKHTSLTTKLRVVFDGSCKTTTGISLNDALMVGPVVQQDLFSIIVRFRTFKYVLNADITKMYRQILIDHSHTPLQRILWRESNNTEIDTFELNTVTYGTTPASFLATRCLQYLSEIEKSNYPEAAMVISRDFYIDDLLTGADSIQEAKKLRDQIIILLQKGCFQLRKWSSNAPELLQNFPSSTCQDELLTINKEANDRTLGMQWHAREDNFRFTVHVHDTNQRITKRVILSRIAQIFDPLGILGPVIILAKILMQNLWQLQIGWDASVPVSVHTEWQQIEKELQYLNNLRIPRLAVTYSNQFNIQIHGFCDASMRAYGACVYLRTSDEDGLHSTILLCAKSKVAPLKCTSLPRLELCGAVLLCQLVEKVKSAIPIQFQEIQYWSDSSIVLAWLQSSSRKWNVFVANRVGEIQQYTKPENWRHVPTKDNPADLISRGLMPSQFIKSTLWWHGPTWLKLNNSEWPSTKPQLEVEELPEKRKSAINLAAIITPLIEDDLVDRYSDLNKLIRTIALCRRFYKNIKSKENRQYGSLTAEELDESLLTLCRQVQKLSFSEELRSLTNNVNIAIKSRIISLTPFIDPEGILRVGGRLQKSSLPYAARHQILLPANHNFTRLIIQHEHIKNLHAGPQSTLAAVRRKFWPLSARNLVRKITRQCITCFKAKPAISQYIMGNLPASRVNPCRPFNVCGVDYGGPLYIREGKRRNAKLVKAYIAMFICFATKAVHIELVGDMSSESFINSFKRFMSRRGKVQHIYSDNGTNFVGASRELEELHNLFTNEQHKSSFHKFLACDGITWHFIPPNAPNFGGLWEAAIKSAKFHLKRIVGEASLNYEEMYTTLVQIEAVLNSRPITPLSDDPNDLSFLTPAHFLIGDTLNSSTEPNLMHLTTNRLSRWQRVEQLRQQFWKRWSTEYLQQMQQRTKWQTNSGKQLQPGQMVLVHQQGLGPLQWILGRVSAVHPGPDGVSRTATITTSRGTYDRPLSRLSILPLDL